MRLNHVTLPARDLERSFAFYKTLGFRPIVKNDHYVRFELPDGDSTFSLQLAQTAQASPDMHICLECDDLDARVAQLKEKGIVFDEGPVDRRWLWREAWLSDPSGNRLCLFYAGQNRRYPPWRLKD